MLIFDLIFSSCPLLLAGTGALFSECTGSLALFLEGLISFSAFCTFTFCVKTNSIFLGILFSVLTCSILVLVFSFLAEKFRAKKFIVAISMNLLFGSLISVFSSLIFKTRGVLTSQNFLMNINEVKIFSVLITFFVLILAILFLIFSKPGLYLRITADSSKALDSKGVNSSFYRIISWGICAFFASLSGSLLTLRISSFTPNIASGRGWMALAIVFLGNRRIIPTAISAFIFCAIDYFCLNLRNFIPEFPNSILQSIPYLVVLLLTALKKR